MRDTTTDGLLLVDKPAGVTSHDVVLAARRAFGESRIGHAGTLDPFATGLLVLLLGRATRLLPHLDGVPKEYAAVIALGSETENLPSFVVIAPEPPFQGAPLWSASFLPASHQGTWVRDAANPIADLTAAGEVARQRTKLDFLRTLNAAHKQGRVNESALDARVASFELAFRMQSAAPEAFDLSRETEAMKAMYGLDEKPTATFGRSCLLARRLVERGVRFVQAYDTGTGGWDHHGGIRAALPARCAGIDKPIAALLGDLKARGLLEDTLVVWGGEFGRTPTAEGGDGREHHPFGFTMFMAGGGVRGGHTHGETDEFGWHAVKDKVHVHDLHATILHLMGLDHERLTYRYGGRDYRLTDVFGNVVKEVLA